MNRIPLRWRVALLGALVTAIAGTAVGLFALRQESVALRQSSDVLMLEEGANAANAVEEGLSLADVAAMHPEVEYEVLAHFDSGGALLEGIDLVSPGRLGMGQVFPLTDPRNGRHLRGAVFPVDTDADTGYLVIGFPAPSVSNFASRLTVLLLIVGGSLVAGAGGYLLAGVVLAPIERLRLSAVALSAGKGDERLDVPVANDELRRLAETFNAGLDRLQEVLGAQRRFVAEASHQLRTPLARLRADVDLARRPVRTHDEVLTALASIDGHTAHLTSLTDGLLRLISPQNASRAAPRSISVEAIIAGLRAEVDLGVSFEVDLVDDAGHAWMRTDPDMLIGALSNLIDNAVLHGAPPIELAVAADSADVVFSVRDHGPGIPVEFRTEVFEPFGRGPSSTGGSGLGLAVVHRFAASQGGDLSVADADPGCLMVLRLPRTVDGLN